MTAPKIVMYYPRALHGDGGVTNSLWLWATSLHTAGALVTVLHDPRLSAREGRVVPGGINVRPVAHVGRGRFVIPLALHRELDPNCILLLHSGYVLFNIIAGLRARRLGVPYVVMPLGAYDPHVRSGRKVVRRAWEALERRLLRQALAVHVFFSAEIGHVTELEPAANVVTAPTAHDVSADEWTADAARGYVAWFGRYDIRHKGLDRLLDAMACLPPEARPTLHMHGRDHKNTRSAVEDMVRTRRISDHVTVGGPIDGGAKEEFLQRASAYIHPARWESYGIALVECLARGIPCLTTTDINLGPELDAAQAAYVVDGSVDGLRAALAAARRPELAAIGKRGRAYVKTQLNHETAGRRLLEQVAALTPGASA